jgi:hypothetical protein
MRLAEALELPPEQRVHLYYAELLKDAGCTAYTSQLAGFWMADELATKRDLQFLWYSYRHAPATLQDAANCEWLR